MQDVQAQPDARQVAVQRVGIKDLHLPIRVLQRDGHTQPVVATIALSVDLSPRDKGTHMSRFVELLEEWREQAWSAQAIERLLADARRRLEAHSAHVDVSFRFFLDKESPVTGQRSAMPYACRFTGSLTTAEGDLVTGVEVPMTTLCPCSKEISTVGAHSQRSWLRVKVRTVPGASLWLEDLITDLETHGSCEVYPLLKRPDEKYVTERAYHNPKFVEDVLRDAVVALRQAPDIAWFAAECEAAESIHAHNAFAYQQETLRSSTETAAFHRNGVATPAAAETVASP
jgi:GTP cyclohydrolase I